MNPFSQVKREMVEDAVEKFPEESCGLIVENGEGIRYISCENTAEDPLNDFRISDEIYAVYASQKKLKAVVHSHNDYPHASAADMKGQFETAVPWGIVNLKNGFLADIFFWGDQLPIPPLKGRRFYMGASDCFTLARDYYRQLGTTIPNFPREYGFWERGEPAFLDYFQQLEMEEKGKSGFREIPLKEAREGDAILFAIRSSTPNHCAVLTGNGWMLHHLIGRLSKSDSFRNWKKYATHAFRRIGC